MKRPLPFLVLAAVLALGACDNNIEPTKANAETVTKNPQVDQDTKSTTGGDQPTAVPQK
ncbi:hypothetical protein [Mesorhizobium sp. LjRoot246]|uniref:hypothetical protein n=1 Tax=Mesorhizobium sp. LjRoot246 TaxID=3342294 RepID=UPI003ECE6849